MIDINTLLGPNVDLRLHEVFEKKDSLRFLAVPADVSAFTPFYSAEADDEEAQPSVRRSAGASEAA